MLTLEHKEILRDIELKFKEARHEGYIVPEVCFEILKEVAEEYDTR